MTHFLKNVRRKICYTKVSVICRIFVRDTNYFLIIPFYSAVGMPIDAILGACAAVNPAINGMGAYLLIGVLPFNLIKGAILTVITMLAYKKLSTFIKSKQVAVHTKQRAN